MYSGVSLLEAVSRHLAAGVLLPEVAKSASGTLEGAALHVRAEAGFRQAVVEVALDLSDPALVLDLVADTLNGGTPATAEKPVEPEPAQEPTPEPVEEPAPPVRTNRKARIVSDDDF